MRREREKEKEREIDTDPCVEFFKIRARTTIIRVITGMNIHDRTSAQQESERNRERETAAGESNIYIANSLLRRVKSIVAKYRDRMLARRAQHH